MQRQVDYDEMMEIVQDLKGLEALLIHLESSEYFKGSEEESLTFRGLRNSLEHIQDKLENIMEDSKEINGSI